MLDHGHDRKRAHAVQEFLAGLPSWKWVRQLHARYCRRILKSCGEGLAISQGVLFEFPHQISLGARVFINRGTIVTARAPISIGDDVLIGPYVVINSGNHCYSDLEKVIRLQGHESAPIVIGSDVWIGAHVTLLAGVKVGDGAVIAAGAVVTRDIPARSVAAGVPAKPIRRRGER